MSSEFVTKRLFSSLQALSESEQDIPRRKLGFEQDLHFSQRSLVDNSVSRIINEMYSSQSLGRKFGLRGALQLGNHDHTLSPEEVIEEAMQQLSVSGARRRRSPHLQAKVGVSVPTNPTDR